MDIQRIQFNNQGLYVAKGKVFNSYRTAKRYLSNSMMPEHIVEEPKPFCEDVEDAEPVDETSKECKMAKKQVIDKHGEKMVEKIEKKTGGGNSGAVKKRVRVKNTKVKDMVNELLSNQLGSGLKII